MGRITAGNRTGVRSGFAVSGKHPIGTRTVPLPTFDSAVLAARHSRPYLGEQSMIFPSTAGTWRDPDNFRARWREVRAA